MVPGRQEPEGQHQEDPDQVLRSGPDRLQRRQLPVHLGPALRRGVVLVPTTAAGPGAGGHVEPLVHRAGDVPTERSKQYSTAGNCHATVFGNSPGKVKNIFVVRLLRKAKTKFTEFSVLNGF